MKLTATEQKLMELLWQHGPLFFKELMEAYPEPKPAATTIATLLKRIQEKGFIEYELYGNSRKYVTLVEKEDYFSKEINGIVKSSFGNSALQFASFFAQNGKFSKADLEALQKLIGTEIKKKK